MVQKSRKYTKNCSKKSFFHSCSLFAQFPAQNHCSSLGIHPVSLMNRKPKQIYIFSLLLHKIWYIKHSCTLCFFHSTEYYEDLSISTCRVLPHFLKQLPMFYNMAILYLISHHYFQYFVINKTTLNTHTHTFPK